MDVLSLNAAIASTVMNQSVVWLATGASEDPKPFAFEAEVFHSLAEAAVRPLPVPDYAGNWKDCESVIVAMRARGFAFALRQDAESLYLGGFGKSGFGMVFAEHEDPIVAICLGALRAMGVEGEGYAQQNTDERGRRSRRVGPFRV